MFRTVVLLLTLTACTTGGPASYRQAAPAYAPVQPPPAMTPGYFPGTPPGPVYTPAGAGLPGERVPGRTAPGVPRSQGRMLPRTDEPGLWAADPVKASAGGTPEILGVPLPLPRTGESEAANRCAVGANQGLNSHHDPALRAELERLPEAARHCAVADFYVRCVESLLRTKPNVKGLRGWAKSNEEALQKEDIQRRYGPAMPQAKAFRAEMCKDFPPNPLLDELVQRLVRARDLENAQTGG